MPGESRLAIVGFLGSMLLVSFLGIIGGVLVRDATAVETMTHAGYRDVTVTTWHALGPVFYGCDREDSAMFAVTAVDTSGNAIDATVCCPLFSACTIRQ